MEPLDNYKLIKNFITKDEAKQIIDWFDGLKYDGNKANHHLKELSKTLNGKSCIFDISNTLLTNYVTNFQSIHNVLYDKLPDFLNNIIERISKNFMISTDNIFLQAVDMGRGGKISPHYDIAIDGYINYKCNISVLSEDYELFIDRNSINVEERDLYCFEASLYKHWTNEFNSRRVFLSIGFLLKYEDLNRSENEPRIRLSKRISKYFQK